MAEASAKMTTSDPRELSPDSSLVVGNNVTLTLQTDALFINGMSILTHGVMQPH